MSGKIDILQATDDLQHKHLLDRNVQHNSTLMNEHRSSKKDYDRDPLNCPHSSSFLGIAF